VTARRLALYSERAIEVPSVNESNDPAPPMHDPQRRQSPREDVRLVATACLADGRTLPVWIHNVSRDGMLIVFAASIATETIAIGKRIDIQVAADGSRPPIAVQAQIRWIFAYGVGVRVADGATAAMTQLRAASNERLKGAASDLER